jgi:hypothetical protein
MERFLSDFFFFLAPAAVLCLFLSCFCFTHFSIYLFYCLSLVFFMWSS